MRLSSIFILFTVLMASPLFVLGAPRQSITIGFNPAENTDLIESNGKRLSEYLKRKTGLSVSTYVAKDYESLVTALKTGKVEFAFLPPFSFVKAEEYSDGKLLLKAVRKGRAMYHSAIFVRADSGIENIEGLKGRHIAWVDKSSAAGFLIPKADLLSKQKVDSENFFGKQTFLGTHDAVVMAVFHKEVDAGATWVNDPEGKDGAWNLYLRKPEDLRQIRVIYLSDPIPGDALTTTKKLAKKEPAMVEKVTKVLQRMGQALDGRQILKDLYGIDQMVPASPKDFESVRAAARIVTNIRP